MQCILIAYLYIIKKILMQMNDFMSSKYVDVKLHKNPTNIFAGDSKTSKSRE